MYARGSAVNALGCAAPAIRMARAGELGKFKNFLSSNGQSKSTPMSGGSNARSPVEADVGIKTCRSSRRSTSPRSAAKASSCWQRKDSTYTGDLRPAEPPRTELANSLRRR
jgi:hypothetical protein